MDTFKTTKADSSSFCATQSVLADRANQVARNGPASQNPGRGSMQTAANMLTQVQMKTKAAKPAGKCLTSAHSRRIESLVHK